MENKEKNAKLVVAGIVAALGASLCCITPILALSAGIAGAASAFSWLDPFRPYLIALTVLVLGFAWYQQLRPQKQDIACACEDKKPFLQTKKFLGVVTVLALLLLSFPYYSSFFFSEPEKAMAVAAPSMLREAKLDIQGMTCSGCENSVNHTLHNQEGVVEATTDYASGTAEVKYDPALISPEVLKATIENEVGYQVTKVEIVQH